MSQLEIIDLTDVLPWNPRKPRWPRQRDASAIDKVILHQEFGDSDVVAVSEQNYLFITNEASE